MNIIYRDTKEFSESDLGRLFLSVNWESGRYPEKLQTAMRNYGSVFSAWDGDRLVGLVSVMDDGIMNSYIQYVLVDPEFQGQGIGKHLLAMVKERYSDFMRIVIVAYNDRVSFYETCGFSKGEGKSPMFIEKF